MKKNYILFFLFFSSFFLYSEENRLDKIDTAIRREIDKGKLKWSLQDAERWSRYKKEFNSIISEGVLTSITDTIKLSSEDKRKQEAENFLNLQNSHGKTVLMYAIQFNDAETVKTITKYGSKNMVNIKDNENKTALFYVFELANNLAYKPQNEKDKVLQIIDALLTKGVDVDYSFNSLDSSKRQYTPLMAACNISEGNDKRFKQNIIEKILDSSNPGKIDEISLFSNYQITPLAYLCTLNCDEKYQEYISRLIEKGADVNKKIKIGEFEGQIVQYLCANYIKENYELIKSLINKGAEIDSSFSFNNETLIPLICAVRSKDNDLITLIIDSIKKADNAKKVYKIKDKDGTDWECSAFHIVAKNGDKNLYKRFKDKGFGNSQKDSKDYFAIDYLKQSCKTLVDELFLAYELEGNDSDIIEESINKIKNLKEEKTSGDYQTTLQVMLRYKDNKRAINLLDKFREDKTLNHIFADSATDINGKNAFDYAVYEDCYDVIKWFIDKHVSIGKSIFTIIDKLLDTNNEKYLEILESFLRIENSNDKIRKRYNYQDKIIEVPLVVYTVMKGESLTQTQIQEKIIEMLIDNNFDINECVKLSTENGNSALIYAIKNKNEELANFLIEIDNINLDLFSMPNEGNINDYGKTAIFYALEKNMDSIVETIIKEKKLQLDDKRLEYEQTTLLMYLARYSNPKVLKALLPYYVQKNRKCIEAKDKAGKTPFLYAIEYNNDLEVAKLLRMYGAEVNAKCNEGNAITITKKSEINNKEERIERLISWGVKENE